MNEHIYNLRDTLHKKDETFIAELAKYEMVNCRNIHVTKEIEDYALIQGYNELKLEKNTLSKLKNEAVRIDEGIKYPKTNVKMNY